METSTRTIRIPRTTAMFVTSLWRILRCHFGLPITQHEHWTFELDEEWSECGSTPGECLKHGMSPKFRTHLIETGEIDSWLEAAALNPCPYQWHFSRYLGFGQAQVVGQTVDLRVHIQQSRIEYDPLDALDFVVTLWVRDATGYIVKGVFGFFNDGRPYVVDSVDVPDRPTGRLAFKRQPKLTNPAAGTIAGQQ